MNGNLRVNMKNKNLGFNALDYPSSNSRTDGRAMAICASLLPACLLYFIYQLGQCTHSKPEVNFINAKRRRLKC